MTDNPEIQPAAEGPTLVNIASRVIGRPLLLHPTKAEIILEVLSGRLPIDQAGSAPIPDASRFIGRRGREDGSYRMNRASNGVAIISIVGSLVNRGAWIGTSSGLVSYEGISAQLRDALADPDIHSILLDLDSPGGEATGMFAVAQIVAEVNKTKPVVAVVNDMAASAAYGIASAASEIVVSPTSIVGSIGVVLTHFDRSGELDQKGIKPTLIYAGKNKVDGNPFGPLSDSVKADLQREVAKFYDQFVALVATGRGERFSEEAARNTEAQTFLGEEAIERGLADRIASIDTVISDLQSKQAQGAANGGMFHMTGTPNAAPEAQNTGITQEAHDAAVNTARTEGAAGERERIAGILNHAEAEGRAEQAKTLALDTDLDAEAAGKVLAASPKAVAGKTIEERAEGAAEFGASGDDQVVGDDAAIDAAFKGAVDKINGKR